MAKVLTSIRRRLIYSTLLVGTVTVSASADIGYNVAFRQDTNVLHVTIHLSHTDKGTRFQLPNWGPGAYFQGDQYTAIKNLVARDKQGAELKVDTVIDTIHKVYHDGSQIKTADLHVCTWVVAPSSDTTVQYDVNNRLVDGALHWSGPGTYLYETSRRLERCLLTIDLPKEWPVYLGLNETKPGTNVYTAKTYDVLADNPVSAGDLLVDNYVSRGKPHWIVMRGAAKSKVDRANLLKACKFVSDAETDFFGDRAPYDKYIWHFGVNDAPDGAGGLEHLSSTQIGLASGVGPRAKSVLAHEFFHLWNVKRIRSRVLGPFDYTKLPETGALWWLEGVTDYYAFTLPHRYGGLDDKSYFDTIASNVQTVRNTPGVKLVGPYESSMRVGEASNGHGNSNGYLISYYNLGWLAGMCLDIELRAKTGGRNSLDDVEHALWDMCKNDQPGFGEDEIRNQMIRFGGPEMGDAYDRIVMKADGMALEATLAKVGLLLEPRNEEYVDLGFTWGGFPGATSLSVTNVRASAAGKLESRDQILAVGGAKLDTSTARSMGASMARLTANAVAGKPITITIMRGSETMDVQVTPVTGTRHLYSVKANDAATPEQKKLGAQWLATKNFKP